MMRIASILLLLGLLVPVTFFGQAETSNWYFGNGAGITFNNDGTVNALDDGQLDTVEGCSTISDSSGSLLFYTDGITIYDGTHQVMENGMDLFGDPSSTQSAIIVPQPENTNVFYVFTVDTSLSLEEEDKGLNYSIVDISLNGGKGAVIEKNVPLLKHSSEKLAAVVKNCVDQSIWLLTLASEDGEKDSFNTYYAYEINTSGIVETPIKSTFENLAIEDPRGYLKISSDGNRIASANVISGLFLYDFDLDTGIVSNQEQISITGENKDAYGVEFSPNGRFLYVHASKESRDETGHSSTLLQFDLKETNISSSVVLLDEKPIYRGALQLGENGKIYRTIAKSFTEGTPFLGVINKPNQKGKGAGYKHDAVSLGAKNAMQGLPPFVQSFFNKTDLITDSNGDKISGIIVCDGEDFTLSAQEIPDATYLWKKDGVPISSSNSSSFEILAASDLDAGRYRLEIISNDPLECPIIGEALVEISPLPETANLILTQCDIELNNSQDGYTTFDLNQVNKNEENTILFYENVSDRMNDIAIANPNKYQNTIAFNQVIFYKSVNDGGCEGLGEIMLQVSPTDISNSLLSPTAACDENVGNGLMQGTFNLEDISQTGYEGIEVTFYSNLDDLVLEENALTENYMSGDATIYARLESGNQCMGVEVIQLFVNPAPNIELADSYYLCTDGAPLTIDAPTGFDNYKWFKMDGNQPQEIGNNKQLRIDETGSYRLEVETLYENGGQTSSCSTNADFKVTPSNRAIFQEINVEDLSSNNNIKIEISGDGIYEYSLDGENYQNESQFYDVEAGFYTAYVRDKNGCGISEKEISVIGFPKFFTPNGDGTNDNWQIIGANTDSENLSISIFDRYGNLLKQLTSNDPGWDGSINGELLPSSDYWFKISMNNGKEFKGHFTLKR